MAIKRKLPDEFRKNFTQSMYGSEVVYVRKTENPAYCLVYYNSNESELGLGLVPEEYPVLTDGKGNKLAYDRLYGPQNGGSDHFYVLDDKVVVVSGVSAQERYKPNPVFEMERDSGLHRRIIATFRSDVDYLDGGSLWKPDFYENVLVSMLSPHEITFVQLKNAYTEGLIAHRLEASGTNVIAACSDASKELGKVRKFQKFVDGFISDFADLLEEGKISHSKLSFCFLEDVSNKFPEVYNKVRDSVLVDRSENFGRSVNNEYKRVALRERIISTLQDTFREGVKALKARRGIRM